MKIVLKSFLHFQLLSHVHWHGGRCAGECFYEDGVGDDDDGDDDDGVDEGGGNGDDDDD